MISVIIPTYNVEKYIESCLKSIITSTYQNFEIIIIDDGSTDRTIEKIREIHDSRIKVYKQLRRGPGSARNFGISLAKGEYIFFVDGDDTINKDTLEILQNNIQDCDIAIGNYKIVYDDGKIENFLTPADCRFNTFFESVTVWNRMYKKDFIIKNNIFFVEIFQGEDRLFLADLYLKDPKIKIVNKYVYNWLRHDKDNNCTLTHIKDHTNFDSQVSCMMMFKERLEKQIRKAEVEKLIEHLKYSCFYLMDILNNSEKSKCDKNKFKIFVDSLNFKTNEKLYKEIFKDMEW